MFGCFAQDRALQLHSFMYSDSYLTVLIQLASSHSVALPSIIPSTQNKLIATVQYLKSHMRG